MCYFILFSYFCVSYLPFFSLHFYRLLKYILEFNFDLSVVVWGESLTNILIIALGSKFYTHIPVYWDHYLPI